MYKYTNKLTINLMKTIKEWWKKQSNNSINSRNSYPVQILIFFLSLLTLMGNTVNVTINLNRRINRILPSFTTIIKRKPCC